MKKEILLLIISIVILLIGIIVFIYGTNLEKIAKGNQTVVAKRENIINNDNIEENREEEEPEILSDDDEDLSNGSIYERAQRASEEYETVVEEDTNPTINIDGEDLSAQDAISRLMGEETTENTNNVSNIVSNQAREMFNSKFIGYEGIIRVSNVKPLIKSIETSNSTNSDHQITVEFNGVTYAEDKISNILNEITTSNKYNVEFNYNINTQYIEKVIINVI